MLWDNIVYILFILAFTTIMAFYVYAQQDASAVWADYYAKEIVKVVDTSQPGEAITLDVHRATIIAKDHQIPYNQIFSFDNLHHAVCVQLSRGRATCYGYFTDVLLTEPTIELGVPINVLHFNVTETSYAPGKVSS